MFRGTVRSIPFVIIMSIVTCGIYPLIWFYEVSGELQSATGKSDTTPGMEVLLILVTCGIYVIYWWFKYARLVAELQAARGLPVADNSFLLVILSLAGVWYGWLDLVNIAIMQSDLNRLWEQSGGYC